MRPIIGTEAIAAGTLTRGQLRWRYTAIYPDVYVPNNTEPDPFVRAMAAWLWTGRTGIIAASTAAQLYNTRRDDNAAPVEVIATHRRTPQGVVVREQRIDDDEIRRKGELPITSPARTALDLGRLLSREDAVVRLDRLAAATGVARQQVAPLLDRYRSTRGIEQAREMVNLMDAGSRSPRVSLLRLRLMDAGLPRPETSISVGDDYDSTVVALGWPGPRVGVDFLNPSPDRTAVRQQILHRDILHTNGWIGVEVDDAYSLPMTLYRIRKAFRHRRR